MSKTNKILLIAAHGVGDCLLAFQCIPHVFMNGKIPDILCAVRDDVYEPLEYLYGDTFSIKQHEDKDKWGHENWILQNQEALSGYSDKYEEIYYVIPDLLFNSPLAFDYKKFNTNPQIIKSTRTLQQKRKTEKLIYMGLQTNTKGYWYHDIPALINATANLLPDYKIYFPQIKGWAGTEVPQYDFSNIKSNVIIDENPTFKKTLDYLMRAEYGVFTCNGPSHIAYQLGIPRLVLDPQFGRLTHDARWKENTAECIPIKTPVSTVANIIKTNVEIPQTCMVERLFILNNLDIDWKKELYFKF